MEKKATFKRAVRGNSWDRHAWEHTDLVYEYRGHEYIVTKHNNGYWGDPLWKQHQDEQARIDKLIEDENKPIPEYTGEAEKAFELFWEYVEGEGDNEAD